MENFFVYDKFYYDFSDYAEKFEEQEIRDLPDDWTEKIELTDLEPIFEIDADSLCELLADANEERLGEGFDGKEKVIKALKESIDFEKLKALLPEYYYPNGKFETITKKDLLDAL